MLVAISGAKRFSCFEVLSTCEESVLFSPTCEQPSISTRRANGLKLSFQSGTRHSQLKFDPTFCYPAHLAFGGIVANVEL